MVSPLQRAVLVFACALIPLCAQGGDDISGIGLDGTADLMDSFKFLFNNNGTDPCLNIDDFAGESNRNQLIADTFCDNGVTDDATWILTSSFVILTMQSGFGLLETGMVNTKNEVNVMMKNVVDVLWGGLRCPSFLLFASALPSPAFHLSPLPSTSVLPSLYRFLSPSFLSALTFTPTLTLSSFWACGYAIGFGTPSNSFMGLGNWFLINTGSNGALHSKYIFQFSFAATSTTIVSGSVAGRMKFNAYMLFSFINTTLYAFPAHWIWGERGW
jgi:hypothetical protein